MESNKKKLLSILTAFVMAFTVFGCTGMSFAEETPEASADGQGVQTMGEAEPDAAGEAKTSGASTPLDEAGEVDLMAGADPVSDTTLTLNWSEATSTQGWDVYYVLNEDSGVLNDEQVKGATTYEVIGLQPDTEYTFTVQAYGKNPDQAGEDEVIGDPVPIKATTDPASINPPTGLKATGAYRTVTLSWGAVEPKYGGTISYEITGDGKTYEDCKSPYKINGLSPRAKMYQFAIKVTETVNGTPITAQAEFPAIKTKGFESQKLTGLISDPGYKAVLLQWNRIDGATGYKVYWRQGGERGNIDNVGKDSDGHTMVTFRSKKTRKYEVVKEPGKYSYLTTVKNPTSGTKVNFDKRGLKVLNHTYVYFYQFMIIPYYDDDEGATIFTKSAPENMYKSAELNKTTNAVAGKSNLKYNIIRNNPVLPMYVLETAKVNKPIYKTCSMGDGKKRGRLAKGHKFICFDKANGRVKFYEKKNVSNPNDTFWFAQKNAHTIQGYYMNNGNKNNLNRKDWETGYSKKTVLDFVNKSGISSKTGYLIWTSKYAQHVYVFTGKKGQWKLLNDGKTTGWKNKALWSNLCTSGQVRIQSRNGDYVIFGKQYRAKRSKYTYYYLSKLHKTVRLHSLLHKKGQKFGGKLYNVALGNPVSKGCIRLRPKVSKWIYDKVPKKTRCKVW